MERETFGSRLGFLLISAGCAIGIGNVWRFPYIAGKYGGGIFVCIYLVFLAIFGIPVLTMEFAVGRASKKSCIRAYKKLEPEHTKWHLFGGLAMLGNYVLVMFYTVVAGWMLYYFYSFAVGKFTGLSADGVVEEFSLLLESPSTLLFWTGLTVVIGILVCSMGLQKGVERITKNMMIALIIIMVFLAVISMTLKGALQGVEFYLVPDVSKIKEQGIFNVVVAALNQAFFTLSLGIGSMMIFGSYLSNDNNLVKESINIALIDTFVAIVAGLIIFPACFAFDVAPESGPSLVFITLPNVFNSMAGGRIWGSLFFLFMSFAALSTIIGVFENILACCMDLWGWSRKKASWFNLIVIFAISVPCVLGFNLWKGFTPFEEGTNIMDLEDYVVSNILLPLGSLITILFCTRRLGWGYNNYAAEVHKGKEKKTMKWLKIYLGAVLPVVVFIILIRGIFRL